mmetsp:Transcript_11338/g.16993  ORF Transcript_11338/g.16993 Transcript_11338/m.16993 type:complete len:549 (+) Transcript_11338:145-1791(+)|eukprot:CAMPEP_0196818484 /NCGR_PEP_ID=MMETSP1362-20130617/65782_1 /TAXON_ID=163516 /ORGANISM="Leptocylindrus danicus, Strain CCMP1856" /LENGTH=548 /DNA_ID=CAMNT_0042196597 /DNA_START=129 /DNA_END=1775 /DNA_ORIENTATION=+
MKLYLATLSIFASTTSHYAHGFGISRNLKNTPTVSTSTNINMVASTIDSPATTDTDAITAENPLKVLIAGGGVGGLALAKALDNMPNVQPVVLERTDQFKRFGGPIQLASNALQVLKEMDESVYEQILEKFTFTGDKMNGIKDGIRNEWYAKFDLATPAEQRQMAYTGVIERPNLQEIYLKNLSEGVVQNGDGVMSYEVDPKTNAVSVTMESGAVHTGDVLIGADGIWSNVRATMRNEPARGDGSGVSYSGYTVFAGELNYDSFDNGEVGYKVYIGPQQYFVITDIGQGRYQWYAFLARAPGSAQDEEKPDGSSKYLQNIFTGWSGDIHHILKATQEDEIEQRDLYDRPPTVLKSWVDGPVALTGDAIHAMMPNLGQGGCQAIEDAFVLEQLLKGVEKRSQINGVLSTYTSRRLIRSASVQGLSRFASDIIIRGFDTPAKIVKAEDGSIKFENFNYAGIVTKMLQPILPIFFSVQFNFLYEGWKNEWPIDFKAALGVTLVGGFILLLGGGEIGLGMLGLEGLAGEIVGADVIGTEGAEDIISNLSNFL